MSRLVAVPNPAHSADGKVRLATLELTCLLLKHSVVSSSGCIIKDVHLACLEVISEKNPEVSQKRHHANEESSYLTVARLRNHSPGVSVFLTKMPASVN